VADYLMLLMRVKVRGCLGSERGQGLAEYGLLLAGVSLLALAGLFTLGPRIGSVLDNVGFMFGAAASSPRGGPVLGI